METVSHSACCCHEHTHEHHHEHSHEHHHHDHGGSTSFARPVFSFILLATGMWLNHIQPDWFAPQGVKLCWFAAAFLPVGLPVMREAWEAMLAKDYFNEFSLMVLAAIGAFCIGEYPEAVAVMLFYTVGETFQHRAVDKARRNIGRLLDVRPEHASVLRNGTYVDVRPQDVQPGEEIAVKPGGRIPLDGTLMEAEAAFDTSALTGESVPRLVEQGGEVLAGMIAAGQTVHVRVIRPYSQSALARILALIEEAASRKAPAERFIHHFARIYTPIVAALAALLVGMPALVGWVVPSFHYVFADWLYRGLVFLVISCPCALVISVPLGYFAGIGAASRCGILFKGGNYLDAITRVDSVAFDKTGTLTDGRFQVTELVTAGISETDLLALALSVEEKSTHPIAQAIVTHAQTKGVSPLPVEAIREVSGQGVSATIGGRDVWIGNARMPQKQQVSLPEAVLDASTTTVVCLIDGKYAGHICLSDLPKADAPTAIAHLKSLCISRIALLSGDKKQAVEAVARTLGIGEAHGELLPEDKAHYVENIARQPGRSVAFVGDGMNDAPVLALSDVGIAMGGLGSDAAIESADVVIQTDQPSKVATAIRIGRATRAIVRQNIVGAIAVKVAVLLAGALGFASLWGAVFADVGVALLAVLNSVRIAGRRFE